VREGSDGPEIHPEFHRNAACLRRKGAPLAPLHGLRSSFTWPRRPT